MSRLERQSGALSGGNFLKYRYWTLIKHLRCIRITYPLRQYLGNYTGHGWQKIASGENRLGMGPGG
jgi:hypothetical protein